MESGVAFIDNLLNRGGIVFMLDVVALVIFALGVGGLMEQTGILRAICVKMLAWADNAGKTTLSTISPVSSGTSLAGLLMSQLLQQVKLLKKIMNDWVLTEECFPEIRRPVEQ